MRVLIMGIGGSGGGAEAAEYYLNQGNEVMVLSPSDESRNEQTRRNLEERGAIFITRQEAESEAGNADIVVKMPGIPVPYIIKKKARRIINDIAALLEDPRTERMKRIIILGSKGKTSTASALSAALSELGIKAASTEGVGYSAFHILSEIENDNMVYDAVIIEMSQWQVRDTAEALSFHWPRIDIIGITDNIALPTSPSDFSAEGGLIIGPWTRRLIIPRFLREKLLFSGIITKAKVRSYPSPLNPFKHKAGSELAWECIRSIGFRRKDINKAILSYKGIPNRLELVAVDNGVSFINDSASVLPISVQFSMRGMKGTPVHLILGGTDKSHTDIEELTGPINDAVSVTLLAGSLTDKLLPMLHREGIRFSGPFIKMEDAVDAALESARARQRGRDTSEIILLSPGAYADENFANEFERGRAFRNYIRKLLAPAAVYQNK